MFQNLYMLRIKLSFLTLTLAIATTSFSEKYDILITNARIVDGTGNPWFRANVGIKKGRIAFVGLNKSAESEHIIDAQGRVLAPGFIDVHTHVESSRTRGGLETSPHGSNFLHDGVTTIITGNCGSSEIQIGKWFNKLEELGLGLNVATLIGHNSVRRAAMGSANRQARPEEIEHMQSLVDVAMKQGAVGFSTGLLYIPGTFANTQEVIALAQAAGRHGGIYSTHIREQGASLHKSIKEAITIGRKASIPVQISHFKIKGKKRWGTIQTAIDLIEEARIEGVDVVIDAYPYDRASTGLSVNLPSWALADGQEAIVRRLNEPSTRKMILEEMLVKLKAQGFEDYSFGTVARFPANASLEGKTITEINRDLGRSSSIANEMETILELIEQGSVSMIYHYMSLEDVETIYRYPNTAIASDGGVQQKSVGKPHPRSYGTNARVLAEFVRKRKTLTLEDAIRRMTSLPAQTFRLTSRGLIRKGFNADLVLFDPDNVQDLATFEKPHQESIGFDLVVVNGKVAIDDGELTDNRSGRIVRNYTLSKSEQ